MKGTHSDGRRDARAGGGRALRLSPEEVEARRAALEERRRRKAAEARRRLVLTASVALIAFLLAAATGYITFRQGTPLSALFPTPFARSQPEDERVTVLVLGTDSQGGGPARADTIMLIGFRPSTGELGIVSIPRDTRVRVPGVGTGRLNAAHAHGGPQLVKRAVEDFVGMPIDYYVEVDFAGFERLVDAVGGVELVVEHPMKYDDYAGGLHIDLAAGRQHLDGKRALHYVRYRGGLGDVALVDPVHQRYDGRIVRQLKFVQALSRQVLRPESLTQLPVLIGELRRHVRTDMPLDRMVSLSAALHRIDPGNVQTALVPGVGQTIQGASYWVADPQQARKVVHDVLLGQRDS